MTKYTPIRLTQLSANESAAVDAINQNLDSIKEYIDDSISRSAKSPSQLLADLDLNGRKLLNLGTPTRDTDVVRLKDVIENKEEIKTLVNTASTAVDRALAAVGTVDASVVAAADSAVLAENWATKMDGPVADDKYSSRYYAENIGADVHTVAQIAEDVSAIVDDLTNINAVADDLSNIDSVADDLENIDAVNENKTNINAVNANKTNIDAVAGNETNINTVAGIESDVSTVADNNSNVTAVATNMGDVNTCATNIAAIQDAPNQAASAAASAEAAAISAAGTHFKLFHHDWFDYELNDMAWLRADTFSWQDGTVYSNAYNHLVDDIDGKTATTETVGSYTISYYLADDGHKITTDEATVLNIYNQSGAAWYYVLDTTNQRFKLPRTKWGFVGLRDVVGKYVSAGLPNITGSVLQNITKGTDAATGCFTQAHTKGVYYSGATFSENDTLTALNRGNLTFRASSSNAIYGNGTTVQPPATQMYLYFYVGQFTQSATEQTAGLNSELFNGKVDLNFSNVNNASNVAANNLNGKGIRTVVTSYRSGATWYRVYSDGFIMQGGRNTGTTSVTFPKAFSNTNYQFVHNTTEDTNWVIAHYTKATTGITGIKKCAYGTSDINNNSPFDWVAFGL